MISVKFDCSIVCLGNIAISLVLKFVENIQATFRHESFTVTSYIMEDAN